MADRDELLVDERFLQYATERQADAINAYIKHGSIKRAAKSLGINASSCGNLIMRAKRAAGAKSLLPELGIDKPFPQEVSQAVSGYSRYFKTEDGGYWVKTNADKQAYLDLIRETVDELKQEVKPLAPIELSGDWDQPEKLMNFHVLSDIHLGALSWSDETGADWDLDIAERTVFDSFRYLIRHSPAAKRGFFCQLGDGLHYDGMLPVTPTSGHIVDADSRYHKVVRASIRIFRGIIAELLRKHETVDVLMATGNHDMSGAVWLQESFAALFEDNPRCNVIVNPSPYYAVMHGKTFLGMHHGHRANMKKLTEVFNGKRYWSMLGGARQAYIHTGHQHHREVKEWSGGVIEMHQTIAAPSSHEAHGGYDADRSMTCITYHTAGKEHSRALYYPEVPDEELPQATTEAQGSVSAA